MNYQSHLTHAQMVHVLDRELPTAERDEMLHHLANCEDCSARYEELAQFSEELNQACETTPCAMARDARQRVSDLISGQQQTSRRRRAWIWAVPAAACVLFALFWFQRPVSNPVPTPPLASTRTAPRELSPAPAGTPALANNTPVNSNRANRSRRRQASRDPASTVPAVNPGFIRLPYSDPALPVQPGNIVRVRMPLSTLAGAGVVRVLPGSPDAWVQADVLLGFDGQPSGIRFVSSAAGSQP